MPLLSWSRTPYEPAERTLGLHYLWWNWEVEVIVGGKKGKVIVSTTDSELLKQAKKRIKKLEFETMLTMVYVMGYQDALEKVEEMEWGKK